MSEIIESMKNTLKMESDALREVLDTVDMSAMERLAGDISGCSGKVVLAGCGTSGAAARKISHTLNCVECPAIPLEPSDAVHGGMGVICAEDIVILLSKGGATAELYAMIPAIKHKGARLVLVTENTQTEMARQSDMVLEVKVSREPDEFNMFATASILAVLAVFDAIAIAIAKTSGYTKERFGVIHPGGAVGERLARMDG